MRRSLLILALAVICAFATSKSAYAAWSIEHEYYSDYFVTQVGWDIWDYCNWYFYSEGTTDTPYMVAHASNCEENGYIKRCYRKVGDEWVEMVQCPPGV